MSVFIEILGGKTDFDDQTTYLNPSNANGRDLLRWLGYDELADMDQPYGELVASELAARCRRRLWPEARNSDPGREGGEVPGLSARVIDCGRRPGYLEEKVEQLLHLAEKAGDGKIRIT
jgi:hypothetical protein